MFFLLLHSVASDLHFSFLLHPLSSSILSTVFSLQLLVSPSLYLPLLLFSSFLPLLSVRYPIPAEISPSFLLNICKAFDPTPVIFNVVVASAASGGNGCVCAPV